MLSRLISKLLPGVHLQPRAASFVGSEVALSQGVWDSAVKCFIPFLWDQAGSGYHACYTLTSPWLYPADLLSASYHVPHGKKELCSPCHSRMYLVKTSALPVATVPGTCPVPLVLQQGKAGKLGSVL